MSEGWALQPWAAAMVAHVEWERETVAHLSSPEPCECEMHRDYRASLTAAKPTARVVRKVTADDIAQRMRRNSDALIRTDEQLVAFLSRNVTRNDPAVVNLSLARRVGALTDRRLKRWSQLTARRESLGHKIALDRARLERLTT